MEDNIREWTGLEFAKSQRAVENREKWRKLVVKSGAGLGSTTLRAAVALLGYRSCRTG